MITFNGTPAPSWLVFDTPHLPGPDRQLNLVDIPGMAGAYLDGYDDGVRTLEFVVVMCSESHAQAVEYEDWLRAWLITDAPCALVLDHDPDRVVMASFDGPLDLVWQGVWRKATLRFIAPDPTRYAADESTTALVTADADGSPFDTVIVNTGGSPAHPIFRFPFTAPATELKVSLGDDYVKLGVMAAPTDTPFEKRTILLHDDCSSASGWGIGTNTSGGVLAGSLTSDGTKLVASSFGSNTDNMHGPTGRKVLSSPAQDFEATMYAVLDNRTPKKSTGALYMYLLDEDDHLIYSARIGDFWEKKYENEALVMVGSHELVKRKGKAKASDWVNFSGILRIKREGVKTTVTVAQGLSGAHRTHVWTKTWNDKAGSATMAPIAKVEVRIARHHDTALTHTCGIAQVDFQRINTPEETDVTYVAEAGDVIEFDHTLSKVFRTRPGADHSEPFMEDFDFDSEFFALPVGESTVSVATDGTIVGATETHRNCW